MHRMVLIKSPIHMHCNISRARHYLSNSSRTFQNIYEIARNLSHMFHVKLYRHLKVGKLYG